MLTKILIVDDMQTYRKILTKVILTLPGNEVTGTASSGEEALTKLAQAPYHVVFLDIEMPGIDGLETLRLIKEIYPGVEVIIISGVRGHVARLAMQALQFGAFAFVPKPEEGLSFEDNISLLHLELHPLLQAIKMRRLMAIARGGAFSPPTLPLLESRPLDHHFACLAIGVSTGGPKALTQLIPALPADFPLPVVVVLHMPANFTPLLANDLDSKSALWVKEAATGDLLAPGMVLLAPGGRHMTIKKSGGDLAVVITDDPPENSCRPAVDVLFRSLAQAAGEKGILAVVLTGMGHDGLQGVAALKAKNCFCITQSERSCVVYGMPKAVDDAGWTDLSVDLVDLAPILGKIAREARAGASCTPQLEGSEGLAPAQGRK